MIQNAIIPVLFCKLSNRFHIMTVKLFLLVALILHAHSLRQCKVHQRLINYYKIKSCHKSTLPIVSWKYVASLRDCKALAREKNGLAFNFSPPEAANVTKLLLPNCHVLGCPEVLVDSTTLVTDLAFDYYSAYGNLNFTQNATCVKSVGLFTLTNAYQNYTQSVLSCQKISGDLADVTSEYRTLMLSQFIKNHVSDWYKAAYVGMDDMEMEGMFITSSGRSLICSTYRAWAPGHPRSKHSLEDCVTLDSDRLWRVVKCDKVKLRGLCELYPQPSNVTENIPKNVTCNGISEKHKGKKRKCLQQKELFNIYQNSSRIDRCALLNFELDKKDSKTNFTTVRR